MLRKDPADYAIPCKKIKINFDKSRQVCAFPRSAQECPSTEVLPKAAAGAEGPSDPTTSAPGIIPRFSSWAGEILQAGVAKVTDELRLRRRDYPGGPT